VLAMKRPLRWPVRRGTPWRARKHDTELAQRPAHLTVRRATHTHPSRSFPVLRVALDNRLPQGTISLTLAIVPSGPDLCGSWQVQQRERCIVLVSSDLHLP
jgi:hypothetical protein